MWIKNLFASVAEKTLLLKQMGRQNIVLTTVNRNIEESKGLTILKQNVLSAVKNLLKTNMHKRRRVRESAEQNYVSITEIKYIGKADVYNMEVRSHHNYSVCGGFIVHNCEDATRYAVMGMWKKIKIFLPRTEWVDKKDEEVK